MKSIKETKSTELIIKRSRFIGIITHVESIEEIKNELDRIKELYPDASHHCFAYVFGENKLHQKYNDDGEPTQTAGVPILNVIHQHDLTDVMIVVVRYFGGTKLGAGGLVRAYTNAAVNALEKATIVYKTTYISINIKTPFDQIGVLEQLLQDYKVEDRTYDTAVTFTVTVKHKILDSFKQQITNATKGNATFEEGNTFIHYE